MKYLYVLFLLAFTAANLIVKHFGAPGLLLSSFLLIPFDFVVRCILHENNKFLGLFLLTYIAGVITYAINKDAENIALGSIAGFTAAQLFAGMFYQIAKRQNEGWFIKVNLSDMFAIAADSIVFQIVAFHIFSPHIMAGQAAIKFAGGLFWYFIIFKKLKLHERIVSRR